VLPADTARLVEDLAPVRAADPLRPKQREDGERGQVAAGQLPFRRQVRDEQLHEQALASLQRRVHRPRVAVAADLAVKRERDAAVGQRRRLAAAGVVLGQDDRG
jgi:hypothetical protein